MPPTLTSLRWPMLALIGIVLLTVGWWAAALLPLPATTPEWVARARAACFGSTENGLPNAGGWILLLGTPPSLLAALLLIAGGEVREELRALTRTRGGVWLLGGSAATLVLLTAFAGIRVSTAYGLGAALPPGAPAAGVAGDLRSAARSAPELRLTDERGNLVSLEAYRGRPVLVSFAYGKCGTVCPVVVRNVLAARDRAPEMDPVVVLVTLDPWRDTPARLPHIARSWGLSGDAHLLGGSIDAVEETLDRWGVERRRDPRNGEIAHASLVHVIDREGRIAFSLTGSEDQIVAALRELALEKGRTAPG